MSRRGRVVDLARERRIREAVAELRDLAARESPENQKAWLGARLAEVGEQEAMAHKDPHRAVRVESQLLARAEALVPRFAASDWGRMIRPSAAAVVKLALLRGMDALEAELPELVNSVDAPEPAAKTRGRKPR
jgi:hypothetical protein